MELRDYLKIFRQSWVLILVSTLVVTALSAVWTVVQTPSYKATSQLYVSVRAGETSLGEMQQGTNYARQAIDSYIEVARTSIVMDRVSEELGGELSPSALAGRVTATSPKNTVLVDISATDSDPDRAALIANTTSSVFADVVVNQLERPSEGAPVRVQIDVVQAAKVPSAPLSPNPTRNLTLGFLLGLMAGLGLAVLRSVLDTRIRTRDDIAAITSAPVLGRIAFDPEAAKHPLLVQHDPLSSRAEAFRTFRTNLQFLKVEGNPHSFVFTSAGASEGKSTTAANLAITIAQAGSTVCIVDGDLRKPRVAELFGVEGGVGVTDVLIGKVALANAVQKWGQPNLFVLPAGHRPLNPSELLGSREMEELLRELERNFDFVIVDAPPVLVVTDAALIAKGVGGALMVTAVGQSRRDALDEALNTMGAIDANVLGIVMTKVPTKGPDAYSYNTYYTQPEASGPKWQKPGHAGTIVGAQRRR
ncbi:polysaccharide biosynthesis tyrosine autokinase [Actinomyces minihominis]|uniref:polysaccharide biosynthesis tyrosine autokinase n=1 Tax=Actinomyces minihominis TaxID=2002838 RepID=UPI000C08C05C|nr:polysaccharide biosynthesis tyrosine autokinase [Actinomyces minihominis]